MLVKYCKVNVYPALEEQVKDLLRPMPEIAFWVPDKRLDESLTIKLFLAIKDGAYPRTLFEKLNGLIQQNLVHSYSYKNVYVTKEGWRYTDENHQRTA